MNEPVQIASSKARKRCAVYCRVSSDERLNQEFNSIDAQREAGQAYVASQRSEGWIQVGDDYDDPGFSGGNTERPGLKRLMADIGRGQIDIVVVYKIDRLTRSLADFSKMVEVFERHGVSFVSVTQQFNTTTSMGRLMLNVLLSFAQFEREVTGERIRDKIAAAKRKGMWMGGVPTLGYDVENRLLIINETEAAVVRRIFEEMLTIGSPTQIAAKLTFDGITTKAWTTQEGQIRNGTQIDKKYLHKLLRNRIFLGEISHKGKWFPGVHAAIIEPALWDRVHEVLAKDSHGRSVETKIRSRTDALLRGLLYAPSGERMYRLSRKIVCTQTTVDTMLKDSEISRYSARRAHRTYTPEFKAELVAACQEPGVSIAALAGLHGMNANVLHRWLKEHTRSACHRLVAQPVSNAPELCAFVPVQLAASPPVAKAQAIKIKVRKGALSMVVTWPLCAVDDLASWTTAVLK